MRGVAPDNLTDDQRERLESNGYLVSNAVAAMPGRMMAHMAIWFEIRQATLNLADIQWGIAEALEGEFLVPDHFGEYSIVPVTPRLCLVAGSGDHALLLDGVRFVNRIAIIASSKYLVAREFSRCPI